MALNAKAGKEFEIVEPGMHKARCVKIIDLGTHEYEYQGQSQEKHKILIMFELPECLMKDGKPFAATLWPTLSLHKKSQLRPLLVSWRGRDFTEVEASNFDVLKLLDTTCLLNIIHNKVGDNTYANIAAIMPLRKTECPARINPLVSFSLSDFDEEVFKSLSEKLQEKIKESREFRELGELSEPVKEQTVITTVHKITVTKTGDFKILGDEDAIYTTRQKTFATLAKDAELAKLQISITHRENIILNIELVEPAEETQEDFLAGLDKDAEIEFGETRDEDIADEEMPF